MAAILQEFSSSSYSNGKPAERGALARACSAPSPCPRRRTVRRRRGTSIAPCSTSTRRRARVRRRGRYDDAASLEGLRFVPERY
jgi:hypothetical protein